MRVLDGVEKRQHLGHLGDLGPQGVLHVNWVADQRLEEGDASKCLSSDGASLISLFYVNNL